VKTRHLDAYHTLATQSDKVWRAYAMCDGLIQLAKHRQPIVISAFTMAGAMAPITMAGALVEQNAECLAGMVLTQLVNPGAPVAYGAFTSNVDMRSGSVALGAPEYAQAAIAGGQLARRYNVPYKSSNVNSSTSVDAQSVYESMMLIWGATLGHANIMAHGIGWLESGLTFSFEKAVIDAEMLQMIQSFHTPMDTSPLALGVESIARVGPMMRGPKPAQNPPRIVPMTSPLGCSTISPPRQWTAPFAKNLIPMLPTGKRP